MRFSLVAVVALAVACDDPSGVGLPCASDGNCPASLVCSAGACAPLDPALAGADEDAADGDGGPDPGSEGRPPFPIDPANPRPSDPTPDPGVPGDPNGGPDDGELPGEEPLPEEPLPEEPLPEEPLPEEPVPSPPGWTIVDYDAALFGTPRVVAGATVELYFLEGPCVGLARAFADGTVDLVASLTPGEGCFAELDAVRDDGLVRVVARRTWQEKSAVLFLDVAAGGLVPGSTGFSPLGVDEHRGVRPHIALTQSGSPRWMWSVRQQYGADLIEQLSASSTAPAVVASVEGLVDDLDYVVDAADHDALFLTDLDNDRLVLRTQGVTRLLELGVRGAIDAVACGTGLHVAYRLGDELRITSVDGDFIEDTIVDAGLSAGRTRGDVALACDAGDLWAAYTLATEGVVRLAGPVSADSGTFGVESIAAAKGGVSLAVVAGARHVAFGSPAGRLRYATRP